ncbi:MAG TPA: HAD family hydrolase [Vicinamibacterales bacterium]|nr:HAD family hydrolase [Vicinamibacterales bacterium]
MRWITFDCFGTLVDWNSGFEAILRPIAGPETPALIAAYHRFERALEAESPHRLYRDVLTTGLVRAAEEIGVPLGEKHARALPDQWGTLPLFPDVEPMLAALRAEGYRLGVLTNCDEDLFARTQRSFLLPFDEVVTAERVRDYKPSTSHFRFFARSTGAGPANWVHVARSWYHDIVPARQIEVPRVWVDRDDTGEDPSAASIRVMSAVEVYAAIVTLRS